MANPLPPAPGRVYAEYGWPAPAVVAPDSIVPGGASAAATLAAHVSGWVNVRAYGSDGVALTSAAAQAVADGTGLLITHRVTISTAVDLGAVPVRVEGGGRLVKSGSGTLTGTGALAAAPGAYVFEGWSAGGLTFAWKVAEVYAQWWGAVSDGTGDQSAAIQAALDTRRQVPLGDTSFTYRITSALALKARSRLVGTGAKIVQATNGIPIVKIGSAAGAPYGGDVYRWALRGVVLEYATQQTAVGGSGIQLGDTNGMAYSGRMEDVEVRFAYHGLYNPDLPNGHQWGNVFERVVAYEPYDYGFKFLGPAAGAGSTSVFTNCYVIAESSNATAKGGYFRNIGELNLTHFTCDHLNAAPALLLESINQASIVGLHLEDCQIPATTQALIALSGSGVRLEGTRISELTFNVPGGEGYLIQVSDGAELTVDGLSQHSMTITAGTLYAINAASGPVYVDHWSGTVQTIADAGSPLYVKRFNGIYRAGVDLGSGASDNISSDGNDVVVGSSLVVNGGTLYVGNVWSRSTGNTFPIIGRATNGAGAVGVRAQNENALTTAGARAFAVYSDNGTTEVAAVRTNGTRFGVRLQSPDGTWYLLTIANGGTVTVTADP